MRILLKALAAGIIGLAVLVPMTILLVFLGVPILGALGVLALPLLAVLAVVDLPILIMVVVSIAVIGLVLGLLGAVVGIVAMLFKLALFVVLPVAAVVWLVRWMGRDREERVGAGGELRRAEQCWSGAGVDATPAPRGFWRDGRAVVRGGGVG